MPLADILFYIMAFGMGLLMLVHWGCNRAPKRSPHIMPDASQRDKFRFAEWAMLSACGSATFYMWMILDRMRPECAADPVWAIVAHGPWILTMYVVLIAKFGHLTRLWAQEVGQ